MFRIGILGSDNSHAEIFSKILNVHDYKDFLPDANARVVALWGQEAERTRQVAQAGQIATIVERPEAMLGQVDAIFCVTRHGGLHLELVQPYLQAGVPAFVDKPLAVDPAEARAIVDLAAQQQTPFTSFSTVRWSADTQRFLADAQLLGGLRGGIYRGPATRRSQYGGIIFYAIHCIELMLMNQGTGVAWVQAVEGPAVDAAGNGNVVVICAWPDGALATLELTVDATYGFEATALGRNDTLHSKLNISDCYRLGVPRILACLRGGPSPVDPAEMVEAIQIGTALEQSLASGARVYLK
jgi:predicted dehydrogenase